MDGVSRSGVRVQSREGLSLSSIKVALVREGEGYWY